MFLPSIFVISVLCASCALSSEISSEAQKLDIIGKKISIQLDSFAPKNDRLSVQYVVTDDKIEIFSHQLALDVLKHSGRSIAKLDLVSLRLRPKEVDELVEAVERYCSDALIEIEFGNLAGYWMKPFSNVKHITFHQKPGVQKPSVHKVVRPMSEIFPALRSLTTVGYHSYLMCNFSHLERLRIENNHRFGTNAGEYRIIQANPQIQSIEMDVNDSVLLQMIGVSLPNLQELAVPHIDQPLHFEHLTKLVATDMETAGLLQLPSIKELELNWFERDNMDKWINFLRRHNHLQRFRLNYEDLNEQDLIDLTTNLDDLEELTILLVKYGNSNQLAFLSADTVNNILQNHKQLKKFSFDACEKEQKQILRTNYHDKWLVEDYNDGLSFQRLH